MSLNNKLIPSFYDFFKAKFSLLKLQQNTMPPNSDPKVEFSEAEIAEINNKVKKYQNYLIESTDNAAEKKYLEQGLSTNEVHLRFNSGAFNYELEPSTRSEKEIIRANIFTLFNIVNFILACFVLFATLLNISNFKNLTFLFVVICNLSIGIFQEIKAKRIVDKLSLLVKSKVLVLRDGNITSTLINNLVIDDLFILQNGDQVPVDAIYLTGEGFELDEALLTGESDNIIKHAGDSVYSGSMVVSGMALLKVDKVAKDTVAAKLSQVARSEKKKRSELKQSLFRIIQFVSVIIVPVGIALFLSQYFSTKSSLDYTIVTCVAALVGMIPEGLILLTEIAFAVGTSKLSQYHCLVQNMSAIEMLARMDTLCLDKTGTITDGSMKVIDLIPLQNKDDNNLDPTTDLKMFYSKIIADIVACTHARGATQEALKNHFTDASGTKALDVQNFSSARKWSAVKFDTSTDKSTVESALTYYLGASEFILHPENRGAVTKDLNLWTERGYRVLLLARSKEDIDLEISSKKDVAEALALIVIEDHIREDAEITLNYFKKQGVELKLISGDNPKTLLAIAKRVGLDNISPIDMSELSEDTDLSEICKKHNIFARSNPYQKRAILKSLQSSGHIVGMTGDGVNDVPALKDADCSIAMVSGSDAARGSADIVLLNDNLSALIQAVYEGRRVINNIQRVASLFLIKTIYSSLLSFIYIFIPAPYPLIPIQMATVSSLTIGIPSFFLALKPNKERVKGKFLEKVLFFAIPAAITVVSSILLLQISSLLLKQKQVELSTVAFIILLTSGFLALYKVSRPLNFARLALLLSLISASLFALIFLPRILNAADIFSNTFLIAFPFVLISIFLYNSLEKLYQSSKFDNFRNKLFELAERQDKQFSMKNFKFFKRGK